MDEGDQLKDGEGPRRHALLFNKKLSGNRKRRIIRRAEKTRMIVGGVRYKRSIMERSLHLRIGLSVQGFMNR